jgi:hypothetical protein
VQVATQKQIDANRRNAQLSTGPKTEEGKRISSMNRLTTGLDAESQFVLGESREEFALLQTEWYDFHVPANPEERFQLDKLIRCEWLLRRYFRIDAQLTDYQSMLVERATGYELGEAFSKASLIFGRLQRRVDAIEKARTAAATELERLKKLPPPPQPKQTTDLTEQLASFLKPPAPTPNPNEFPQHPRLRGAGDLVASALREEDLSNS